MNKAQLLNLLTLVSCISLLFAESAQAQISQVKPDKTVSVTATAPMLAQASPVKVTGVQLKVGEKGIEIILETPTGTLSQPVTKTEGNVLTAEISNAVLALPNGESFTAQNPSKDIQAITVTQADNNTLITSVTGDAAPQAEVISNSGQLVLSVTPANQTDIELTVTGSPSQTNVTKTDTNPRDLPFSIQEVPQRVIQEQRIQTVKEAVSNISGFSVSGAGGGRGEFQLQTRGFVADQYRDGFTEDSNSNRVGTEISNLERIEVLKGPSAALYGQSDPGGAVNLVTKQPLFKPYYSAEYTAGSYSFNRGIVDIGGPLDDNGKGNVRYRLNFAYEDSNSFREGVEINRLFVAPKFAWDIGKNTTLNLSAEYLQDSRPFDFGLVAVGNGVANIPIRSLSWRPKSQK